MAVDDSRNVFIADYQNQLIYKVNTAWLLDTFAGSVFGSSSFYGDGDPDLSALFNCRGYSENAASPGFSAGKFPFSGGA